MYNITEEGLKTLWSPERHWSVRLFTWGMKWSSHVKEYNADSNSSQRTKHTITRKIPESNPRRQKTINYIVQIFIRSLLISQMGLKKNTQFFLLRRSQHQLKRMLMIWAGMILNSKGSVQLAILPAPFPSSLLCFKGHTAITFTLT